MTSEWIPVNLKERLYYIDALRAFLMTYGIVLHADMFMQENIRTFISDSSHLFRMQTFFIVSGFFTAMIFFKSSSLRTFCRRVASILIPFFLFVLCANPFANYILAQTAGSEQSFKDLILNGPAVGLEPPLGITWHLHLWFLTTLAIFTCAYPAIKWLTQTPVVIKALKICVDWVKWKSLSFLLLTCTIAFSSVILRGLYFITLEKYMAGNPFNHILVSTVEYIPFFAVGAIIFFYKPLFELFHHFFYGQMLVAFAGFILLHYFADPLKNYIGDMGFELCLRTAGAFCSVYSANLLFNFFSRFFNGRGRVAKFLSDAAYSVYLLHLYILIGIYYFFYEPGQTSTLTYLISIITTYGACLAIHHFVISKFKITRALINGKLPEATISAEQK